MHSAGPVNLCARCVCDQSEQNRVGDGLCCKGHFQLTFDEYSVPFEYLLAVAVSHVLGSYFVFADVLVCISVQSSRTLMYA